MTINSAENAMEWNIRKLIRRLIPYGIIIAFAAAALSFFIGFLFSTDSGRVFWSGFLLNLAAELMGVALTLWGAAIVAGKKLDNLTPRLVDLIAHLRKDKKIGSETARSAVICMVEILSEDRLRRTRPSLSIYTRERNCRVCLDSSEIDKEDDGSERCKHCRLKREIWN